MPGRSRCWTAGASGSSSASRTGGPRRARPDSSAARPDSGNRRGPLRGLFLSESVSRILSGAAIHLCGPPGPRRAGSEVLLGLAPGGVCHARPRHRVAGALLPHPFTLTCARHTCGRAIGGLLSVALSRGFPRVGVTHRPCPLVSGLSSKTPFVISATTWFASPGYSRRRDLSRDGRQESEEPQVVQAPPRSSSP